MLVVACGAATHDIAPRPLAKRAVPVAPGPRLPGDVEPLAYDLELQVDPDTDELHGHVAIRVRVHGTDHVWLHASGLAFDAQRWTQAGTIHDALPVIATQPADEMVAFDLGEVVTGEIELHLTYHGRTGRDEEGLFRQEDRGRWYLYTQSESVFARRFVPCFDEPRFKTPWRVTVTAPAELRAFANAPELAHEPSDDGRRVVHRFAATPAMPSYLLAIAVGPFDVVDAGAAGDLPLRAIVLAGDADRAGVVAAKAPELIAALEAYTGTPLPWPKLDFVAVPHLFGAMENPGLVTFDRETLVGPASAPRFAAHFVRIAGHELAHMWFGDSVTPAWWDDLWLAEAFAQWLADKLASQLHAFEDEPLDLGLARERALAADDAIDARPLHHAVVNGADAEGQFDAISYEKGSALLASFERLAGETAFRSAIRHYLAAHAGGTATTADFIAALAKATTPEIAHALAVDVDLAGAPIVSFAPCREMVAVKLVATARNGVVPLCYRTALGSGCTLVADRKEIPVSGLRCTAYSVANAGGLGYYASVDASAQALSPGEELAHGDDIAAMLGRGELRATRAADELRRMSVGDVYAQLGAMAIARALVPSVAPAALATWLGKLFAPRLTVTALLAPHGEAERALRDALLDLAALPAIPTASLEHDLAGEPSIGSAMLVVFEAQGGGRALFDRVLEAANRATGDVRAVFDDALASFGADVAPHAIELVARGELPVPVAIAYFARPATRAAAWTAVRAHLAELLARATRKQATDLVAATGTLCDARAEVAAAFEPHVADILDGRRTLDRALATIDRCVARRAAAGSFTP